MSRASRGWYYVDKQGRTVGPKSVSELKPLYASKAIGDKTFIWNGTSVDKWTTIKKVPSVYSSLKQSSSSHSRGSSNSGGSKLSLLQRVKIGATSSNKSKSKVERQERHANSHHHATNSKGSTRKYRSNSKPIALTSSSSATQPRPLPVAKPTAKVHDKNSKHSRSKTSTTTTNTTTSSTKTRTTTSSSSSASSKEQSGKFSNKNSERHALVQKSKHLRNSNANDRELDEKSIARQQQQQQHRAANSKRKQHSQQKQHHHMNGKHGTHAAAHKERKSAANHMQASRSLDSLHCVDEEQHGAHKRGVSAAAKKRARQNGSSHGQQASLTVVTKPALRVTRNRGESAISTESSTVSTGFGGSAPSYLYPVLDPSTPPSTRSSYLQPTPFTYGQHLAPNHAATESVMLSTRSTQPTSSTKSRSLAAARSNARGGGGGGVDDGDGDTAAVMMHREELAATSGSAEEEQHRYSSVSADDIDQILDEIEKNEQRQQALRAKIHLLAHSQHMVPTMASLRQTRSTPVQHEHVKVNPEEEGSQQDGDHDEENYEEDEELKQETLQRTDSGNTTRSAPVAVAKLIPFKVRPKIDINWDELTAVQRQKENVNAIRKIIGRQTVDINTRNPRDGTTLLMHAIIIGDLQLVEEICRVPSINISIKDNDGDDAIDYALIFQRYKVTHLLLMMKHGLTQKSLAKLIEAKRKEAEFMRHNTFGKFQHNMIQFVVKAIRERKPFDINLLFFAWYFVNHGVDKINGTNPFPDPLNSIFFKAVMKCYAQCTKHKSKNKRDWYWLRRHIIDSIMWLLPHPDEQHPLYKPDRVKVNMTTFDDYCDESETSDGDGAADFDRDHEYSYSAPLSTASFDSMTKDVLPISPSGHAKGDLVSGGGENLLSFLFL